MPDQSLTRRALLAMAGGGALTTALAGPAWSADSTRPGAIRSPRLAAADARLVRSIRPGRLMDNLRHLSETIGQRYSGTPGEVRAADYLAGVLDNLGYDVQNPAFAVPDVDLGQIWSPLLDADLCWECRSAAGAPTGVQARGPLTPAYAGVAALPADLSGRVVLARDGAEVRTVVSTAQARGAAAVIVLALPGTPPRQTGPPRVTLTTPATVPVLSVGQVQGAELERVAAWRGRVRVSTTAHRNLMSRNVIATRPGRLPVDVRKNVMISAHYDSVIGAKGANDDGSGTVLALELARVLRTVSTGHNVQIALWGAEEIGLVGSRQYVASLDPAERAALLGVFQNDMVGTSWAPAEKYWVLSYDGAANPVNAAVLAAGERLGYRQRMSDVTERGASDHQSFQEVGIASGNFSWRGVDAPSQLEPEYHSADDTIAQNISVERLTGSIEIIGLAAYALANSS